MRAFKQVAAIATCLVASVMGSESFVNSSDFKRELHKGDDNGDHGTLFHASDPTVAEDVEYPDFTQTFAYGADTYGKDYRDETWEISEISTYGLIIGAVCTGIFILFALIQIIIDEVRRHADFTNKVETSLDSLRAEPFNYSEDQIRALEDEFAVRDAQDEAAALEAERKELAEIN